MIWRKWRADFSDGEIWYDLYEDYDLIEASFAQQYGIRLRNEDEMSWSEFCSLLSGIMPDTPLGKVVAIRAEKDGNVLKTFSKEQMKIHNDWILRRNQKLKENPEVYRKRMEEFQMWCKANFS